MCDLSGLDSGMLIGRYRLGLVDRGLYWNRHLGKRLLYWGQPVLVRLVATQDTVKKQ